MAALDRWHISRRLAGAVDSTGMAWGTGSLLFHEAPHQDSLARKLRCPVSQLRGFNSICAASSSVWKGTRMTSCRGWFVMALMVALYGPLQTLQAESPAPPPTAQQIYNEAQAAFDKSDWPAAIKGFASIARPDDGGEMSHAQGIIHARLAQAYAQERMIGDAEREAALALKGLGPPDRVECALMWLALGEAQRYDLANTRAIDSYERGLAAAQEAQSAELVRQARVGLALSYMTVSPDKAAPLLDAVLAAPDAATYPKLLQAQYYDLRGRASLNLGQAREALPFLTKAIHLSGGIGGSQVNLIQVGIRGDAAIGHVIGAAPIYASRPGMLGIAFAKAVKEWKWNPERIATLPSFWRNWVRVELRCIARQNPRGLSDPFRRETLAWLKENQLAPEDLALLGKGYVAADDPRLERDDLAAIPALMARLPIETNHKRVEVITRHLTTALDNSKAPAAARALAMNLEPGEPSYSWSSERVRTSASHLATMERTDPQSMATAWIRLEYAIALEANGRFRDARPVLERVLAYPPEVLGEHDPVRDVATLHLAALQRRAGDAAGADSKVKAAGLTRAQCMLFDVRPVVTDNAVFSRDFPEEALRWGFDGYVREAFDINADGHVENVRTIIAYPPFVFRTGAEQTVVHFRYLAPVVDGVSAGCDGHTIAIKYKSGN